MQYISRGSPLNLSISLGVLALENIEDPWPRLIYIFGLHTLYCYSNTVFCNQSLSVGTEHVDKITVNFHESTTQGLVFMRNAESA